MITLPKTVSILGTNYKIELRKLSEDSIMRKRHITGYCNQCAQLIVVADVYSEPIEEIIDPDNWLKKILRHEIVHAFLNESGLAGNADISDSPWAKNEEMVDWIAIQGPKLYKIWNKLGIAE